MKCLWLMECRFICVGFLLIGVCFILICLQLMYANKSMVIPPKQRSAAYRQWIYHKVVDNKKLSANDSSIIWGSLTGHSRLCCIVLTMETSHNTRGRAISQTWGRRCDETVFSTNTPIPASFNTMYVGMDQTDKKYITQRIFRTLRFAYNKLQTSCDWFYLADDDTYAIVENLRNFIKDKSIHSPKYYGFNYSSTGISHNNTELAFAHGGSGIVMNGLTLKQITQVGYLNEKEGLCHPLLVQDDHDKHGDVNIGFCLLKLGIIIGETQDKEKRVRFFKHNPFHLLNDDGKSEQSEQNWFSYRNIIKHKGVRYEALSPETISFHYMSPGDIYLVDFLLYNLSRGEKGPIDNYMLRSKTEKKVEKV